jgi:hypothetical protein
VRVIGKLHSGRGTGKAMQLCRQVSAPFIRRLLRAAAC